MTVLGKVVKSNTHTDYVGQIYGPGEIETAPEPSSYAFGTFVRLALGPPSRLWLVGLIYDIILLNPEFGWLGPRLSSPPELAVFSPDYLNEKVTLVGITAIGTIDSKGQVDQGIPQLSAMTDTTVETMPDCQIRLFHEVDASLRLAYVPRLMTHSSPLALDLLRTVLQRLQRLDFQPKQHQLIKLILDNLTWQRHIVPFGVE